MDRIFAVTDEYVDYGAAATAPVCVTLIATVAGAYFGYHAAASEHAYGIIFCAVPRDDVSRSKNIIERYEYTCCCSCRQGVLRIYFCGCREAS